MMLLLQIAEYLVRI